jgi:hypothetical protein
VTKKFNRAILRDEFHYYRQWYYQRLKDWYSPPAGAPVLKRHFVFMHIPKAGGSSARHFFKSVFPARLCYAEPRLARFPDYASVASTAPRVYLGHLGFHFACEAGATSACLLRHPVERLLSLYSYSVNPGRNRPLIGGLPPGMSLLDFLRSDLPGIRMNADNGQTWQIGYGYSAAERRRFDREDGRDILAVALQNLDAIEHIGVIEKFGQFRQQVRDTYGGSVRENDLHQNISPERLDYSELSLEEKRAVEACIALDLQLYEAVLRRLG